MIYPNKVKTTNDSYPLLMYMVCTFWKEVMVMGEWALEMKGISKKFPGTQALSEVDFSLKKGEIHALIGENGAGKSTLMNVLMGVHKMDSGEIFLNGQKIENKSPYDALLKGICMVPQELNLIPEVSVAENIFVGNEQREKKLIDWKTTIVKAKEYLKKLGVDIDVTQKVSRISAAYQQLVSIARALAAGSQILVLDEPTASLTISETEQLFKAMRQLRDEGKSIIFITHHLDEVKAITNNITVMRDGKVVHKAETKDLSIDEMIFYMANRKVDKAVHVERNIKKEVFLEVNDFSRDNEFENVSFNIYKGEIFGVAGLVGAGRTELFKSIYGLSKKKTGKTIIEGKEIDIKNTQIAINEGIGYVPEERRKMGIFPVLSLYENMMIPSYKELSKSGLIDYSNVKEMTDHYIDEFKIKTPSGDKMIKDLSGGNQQKVILARWMAKKVKMLILDEPTRGIDVNAKGEIYKLIRAMADEGMTVVVISSEIEETLTIADRIMVMHEGQVKGFVDNPQDYAREDILKIALQ
jgi:ABC-type sugar transport system ATPase subunit